MKIALGIVAALTAFLAFTRWLMRKATLDLVVQEAEKIEAEIRRKATLERESVDQKTAAEVEALKTKSDAELEKDLNR